MSRKHAHRTSHPHRSHLTKHAPDISVQDLEARWHSLKLLPQTRDHLEQLVQAEGVGLALAATTALDLELQHEEQKVIRSIWGWISEELRLTFLEEGCQHLLETGRLLIDACLTWSFVQGPFLLNSLVVCMMALGVLLLFCCMLLAYRHYQAIRYEQRANMPPQK
ncbi:hypothetical protein [Dictyobacter aurantiacus]|uniref:Uncharacterized protein n=1 Tax=Dictyobacter aurantiacus TaxID=1936993 RepID=A0A401ZQQ5_9CHLR|nr:hypothetical protein [Dictyobacter aurantiacus]GCE09205.1 hypothetical protein KDAU_65340 [Dictyobacter aurantiacus]